MGPYGFLSLLKIPQFCYNDNIMEKIILHDHSYYFDPENPEIAEMVGDLEDPKYKSRLSTAREEAESTTEGAFEVKGHHFRLVKEEGVFRIKKDKF